jgi:hypothetical protein
LRLTLRRITEAHLELGSRSSARSR